MPRVRASCTLSITFSHIIGYDRIFFNFFKDSYEKRRKDILIASVEKKTRGKDFDDMMEKEKSDK